MSDKLERDQMLASTAHWIAAVRALESAREDRLFNDPWASALAGTQGMSWIEGRSADSVLPIVLRTRFFDDTLQRIVAEGEIRQVVLMAAGLDTRAFRLTWPAGTRLFELDQAAVLEYKARVLRTAAAIPTCERYTIGVDLTSAWEGLLIKAGFDPQDRSVCLLEGFLFYLSIENLTPLLDRVMDLAAPGSYLCFDIINSLILTSLLTKSWVDMQASSGAPWIGSLDDPQGYLASRGWDATLIPIGAPGANYGRWTLPVIPASMPDMPHLWFVIGKKE